MGKLTIKTTRSKPGMVDYTTPAKEVTAEAAAAKLAEFELGFGGRAVKIEPGEVRTMTTVFDTVDTVVITGDPADMLPVVSLCALHAEVISNSGVRDAIVDKVMHDMNVLGIQLTPLNVTMFGPLLMGAGSVKATFVAAMGIQEPERIEAILDRNLSYKDMAAAFEMTRDYGVPIETALDAAA